jgi:hypothetical protein
MHSSVPADCEQVNPLVAWTMSRKIVPDGSVSRTRMLVASCGPLFSTTIV